MRKRQMNDLRKKGFTLVELIVVIVIILILGAVLVPNVLRYVSRAQAAACAENRHSVLIELTSAYTDGEFASLDAAFAEVIKKHGETCPNKGTYSLDVSENSMPKITCSFHKSEPDTGGETKPGDTGGFGIADSIKDSVPQEVVDFFAQEWSVGENTNDQDETVEYKYLTFKSKAGKNCCLILSSGDCNNGGVKKELLEKYGDGYTYMYSDKGTMTNDSDLETLSEALGLDKIIDEFSYDGEKITKIVYK